MKLNQSIKKSLSTVLVFILGVFAVTGLSYATSPTGNAFIPINEGSSTQVRCQAKDTSKVIRSSDPYTDCDTSAKLITNGVIVAGTQPFEIQGDPKYSDSVKYSKSAQEWANGALYVGCSSNSSIATLGIRSGCNSLNYSPEAYFYGNIKINELADPNATGDRKICISTSGLVKICP